MNNAWTWAQRAAGAVGWCACFLVMLQIDFWTGVGMAAMLGLAAGLNDAIRQD